MRSARRGGRPARGAPRNAPRTEQVATVRVEGIAAGGDGIGRIDGLACFIPRTAPGDVAQVAYISHARYARGRVLQLLESSPDRVTPSCRHYVADRCGGCQLQHLSVDAQREVRRRIVRDALQRVGHRAMELPALVADAEWAYRERLTLALRARGTGYVGGLHAYDDPSRVFALEECPITDPRLTAAWMALQGRLRGLPSASADAPLRLSLRLSGAGDDVAVVISGGAQWEDGAPWADDARRAVPMIAAIWWEPTGSPPVLLSGDPGRDVLAFAQVNAVVSIALREHVLEVVRALNPASAIDAYCGRGDLAAALARQGVQVTAIEADGAATQRAAQQLEAFSGSRVVTAMVESVIAESLPADVVVLNPPRRGVDIRVTAALADAAHSGVQAIVYVSCDPATLARDVARLPLWRVSSIKCFDMFPQTAHVESVCVLVPGES